jgi:crotonobetainyl-CoA:carnitine CoA-transferase CaiB-like acyl-CoA transferase
MLDAMISTMTSNYMSYLGSGVVPEPMGTSFPTVVPYRVFPTLDAAVAIAVGSDRLWAGFCRAVERPDLAEHPDYAANADRIRNRHVLEPLLEAVFRGRTTADWMERLQSAGIPASPVRNLREVVQHPHSAAREMFPTLDHPVAGRHRVTGTPVKLSGTPGAPGPPAPLLGQHSAAVLKEVLGLDDAAISALAERGVIYERNSPARVR